MAGKGSKRRPGDDLAFGETWDRVFGGTQQEELCLRCGKEKDLTGDLCSECTLLLLPTTVPVGTR